MKRCELDVTVANRLGLHARPAAALVRRANAFKSNVLLVKDGEEVNCKSVLSLMMLAAGEGTRLRILAEGAEDAEDAAQAIARLFAERFGEE